MPDQQGKIPIVFKIYIGLCLLLLIFVGLQFAFDIYSINDFTVWKEVPAPFIFKASPTSEVMETGPNSENGSGPQKPLNQEKASCIKVGDILLSIDRYMPADLEDAKRRLNKAAASKVPIYVEVFRPSSMDRITAIASGNALKIETLPPAILISYIIPGKPAAKADVRQGDLLIAINGKPLDHEQTSGISRLTRWLQAYGYGHPLNIAQLHLEKTPVGGILQFELLRNGEAVSVEFDAEYTGASLSLIVLYFALWVGLCAGLLFSVASSEPSVMRFFGALVLIFNLYALWSLQKVLDNPVYVDIRDAGLIIIVIAPLFLSTIWDIRIRTGPTGPVFIMGMCCLMPAMLFGDLSGFVHPRYAGEALIALLAVLPFITRIRERQYGHWGSFCFFIYALAVMIFTIIYVSFELKQIANADTSYLSAANIERMLFSRGPIPVCIFGVFITGVLYLLSGYINELRSSSQEITRSILVHAAKDANIFGLQDIGARILERIESDSVDRLQPVSWAQTSLPLLGFLGTIVGLAEAMANISQELLSGRAKLAALQQGFSDVALAFETTLLGLAGLLLLTTGEYGFKSHVVRRLKSLQAHFDSVIGSIETGSVLDQVSKKTKFDSFMLNRVALVAEHPVFDAIQAALLAPTVEFAKDDRFRDRAIESLKASLNEDDIVVLGIAKVLSPFKVSSNIQSDEGRGAVLVVKSNGGRYAIALGASGAIHERCKPASIAYDSGSRRLLASSRHDHVLVEGSDSNWSSIKLNGQRSHGPDVTLSDSAKGVWIFRSGNSDWVSIVDSNGKGAALRFGPLSTCNLDGSITLPSDGDWSRWAFDANSGELYASGTTNGIDSKGTRFMKIAFRNSQYNGNQTRLSAQITANIQLDDSIEIQQLWPIPDGYLLLETTDELIIWNTRQPDPKRLRRDWEDKEIVGISGHWIAVFERTGPFRKHLYMWAIRGGRLYAYKSKTAPSYQIIGDTEEPAGWAVTGDGRRLLAYAGGKLLAWRFPRCEIDEYIQW